MESKEQSRKCAILQSSYLPWKGYLDLMNSVDDFVFYDVVQFTKNDWRNRNKIKTSQGLQWLTVPVQMQGRLNHSIDQIRVADADWKKKHWKAICQNYSRCRYFEEYRAVFQDFYASEGSQMLSDINQQLLKVLCAALDVKPRIYKAGDFALEEDRNLRLVSICKQLKANLYLSGPAAKSYLDEALFEQHGIQVQWMDFSHYPEYSQRFPPFEHKVSVIDLIFNEGPGAREFLLSTKVDSM